VTPRAAGNLFALLNGASEEGSAAVSPVLRRAETPRLSSSIKKNYTAAMYFYIVATEYCEEEQNDILLWLGLILHN
jgi:hypothetical protein